MTLNITLIAPWGIWQCSDYRLVDARNGQLMDDYSTSHLAVTCQDGSALIAYTGLCDLGGVHTWDWLRRILRGQAGTLNDTLGLIREAATATFGEKACELHVHHTFTVGAFLNEKPWAIGISNIQPVPDFEDHPPLPEFSISAVEVQEEPFILVTGTREAVGLAELRALRRTVSKRPKRPAEYRKLLANTNRKAAKHPLYGQRISTACLTSYMPPMGASAEQEAYNWGAALPQNVRSIPHIVRGIDSTDILQSLFSRPPVVDESGVETDDVEDNEQPGTRGG